MNPLTDAPQTLLVDSSRGDWSALCGVADDGAVTVRGPLPPPPAAGTAEALWAGWGPAPGTRHAHDARGPRAPWLVAWEGGDLRIWMHHGGGGDLTGRRGPGEGRWWFTRPLPGVPVRSAAACFEAGGGPIYIPYLILEGKDPHPTRELRVRWFATRWRDEPASTPAGLAEVLAAAAWGVGAGRNPRLVLFWLDDAGGCRWGVWRRLPFDAWELEHKGAFPGYAGTVPGQAGATGRVGAGNPEEPHWRRLWLAPVPGGGASAIALAAPGGMGAGGTGGDTNGEGHRDGKEPRLLRLDFRADGTPRTIEYRLNAAGAPGASQGSSGRRAASPCEVDLAGWWMAGDAALVLLLRHARDAGAEIEGCVLAASGDASPLGRVPAGAGGLQVARAASTGCEPVTPCHVPLLAGGPGCPRPWPVPVSWFDALRLGGPDGRVTLPAAARREPPAGTPDAPPGHRSPAGGDPARPLPVVAEGQAGETTMQAAGALVGESVKPQEAETPEPEVPLTAAPEAEDAETEAPEAKAPEAEALETAIREREAPEAEAPEMAVREAAAPPTEEPEAEVPETAVRETEAPPTEARETETRETETPGKSSAGSPPPASGAEVTAVPEEPGPASAPALGVPARPPLRPPGRGAVPPPST